MDTPKSEEAQDIFQEPRSLPRLNEPAPDFEAQTTHGIKRLDDYEGRWLVLFSHPADFTPVCTTEFMAFAEHYDDFQELNADLLGLSIDSYHSHIAWTQSIKEKLGVEIPFPIIDDVSMQVASAYGMVHPGANDTATVRTTFLIDPEGILRAMLYYPMEAGRSVPEVLRLLKALQTTDEHDVATPEGWEPGESVLMGSPQTLEQAEERVLTAETEGHDCKDWYLCFKDVDGQTATS
jgi:peroxiredoxin (alkyl hydroperoxide reductase subunit C)